jgi:hypothetical protein
VKVVRYLVLVFGVSIVTACNFTWEPSPGFDEPAPASTDMGNMHGGGGSNDGAGGAFSPEGIDSMAGPNDLDAGIGSGGAAALFDMSMEAPDGDVSAPPCHDAGPSPDGDVDGGDDRRPSCDSGVECADGGDGACAPVFDGASSPLDAR